MSKDLCVCKESDEAKISEGLAEGTLKRCAHCGNTFAPDAFSDVLCGDCRGTLDEVVEQDSETEDDVIDSGVKPIEETPVPVFSAIPEVKDEEPKTEIPVPQKVTVRIKDVCEKGNEDAKLLSYLKNPATNEVVFRGMNNDTGKPIEMTLSEEFVQQLVRELLPEEKRRQQELLDKMYGIRKTRGLSVEIIDKLLSKLMDECEKKFDACKTGTDVKKVEAMFRAKLSVLTQKRYLSKFSIQEESELSLQLAKLQHGEE